MSDDEAWDFLRSHSVAILTTLRRDGSPVSLPLWYAVDDRKLYFRTPSHSKKLQRMRVDHRVAVLVEDGEHWKDLRAVHVNGTAREVTDPSVKEAVGRLIDGKYRDRRSSRSDMPASARQTYERERSLVEVHPQKFITWDNSRLSVGGADRAAPGTSSTRRESEDA